MAKELEEDMGAYQIAENLVSTALRSPHMLASHVGKRNGEIHDKLLDIYLKQCSLQRNIKTNVQASSNLLSKLVHGGFNGERLNTLVVNLKRLSEGFSLELCAANGQPAQTVDLPYQESELLELIENEELPHNLLDLLEKSQPNLFYDGCIIAELRDKRRCVTDSYRSSFVLLKPSLRSLLADINGLTADGHRWTQEDRLYLESQLLLATSDPLCLEPSPTLAMAHNKLSFRKRVMQSRKLLKSIKPYTAAGTIAQRMFARLPCHRELPVLAFLEAKGSKLQSRSTHKMMAVDSWMRQSVDLDPVESSNSDVQKLAKAFERPCPQIDCMPNLAEEYILETEIPGKTFRSRLVIINRNSEDRYSGELHMERTDWPTTKSAFELGNKHAVEKYVQQFLELFTEEKPGARMSDRTRKITLNRPGQPPQIVFLQVDGQTVSVGQSQLTTQNQGQGLVQGQGQVTGLTPGGTQSTQQSILAQVNLPASSLKQVLSQQQPYQLISQEAGTEVAADSAGAAGEPCAANQTINLFSHVNKAGVAAKTRAATPIINLNGQTFQQVVASSGFGATSVSTVSIQSLASLGITSLQGLQNVQVSLASRGAGGITLISSSQAAGGLLPPNSIILSGPLSVVESRTKGTTSVSQGGIISVSTAHPIMMTNAGSITQILEARKGAQNPSQQQLSLITQQQLQSLANQQQTSAQLVTTNQSLAGSTQLSQQQLMQLKSKLIMQQGQPRPTKAVQQTTSIHLQQPNAQQQQQLQQQLQHQLQIGGHNVALVCSSSDVNPSGHAQTNIVIGQQTQRLTNPNVLLSKLPNFARLHRPSDGQQ